MHPISAKASSRIMALTPLMLSGIIGGIANLSYAIAFAAIIFAGDLAPHLAFGISLSIFSAAVVSIVTSWLTALPGAMAHLQEVPVLLLSLIISDMVTELAPQSRLPTALVLIALTTCLVGCIALLLGTLRLGNLVRYVPYPVIGGFLAGTGWFISLGALLMMLRLPRLQSLNDLLAPSALPLWLPGLVFAILLLWLQRRYGHPLTLPAMLLGAWLMFLLSFRITQTSTEQAATWGLLLGPFDTTAPWQPLSWQTIGKADWWAIAQQWEQLLVLLIVVLMAALLNITSLEVVVRQEMHLNRELQTIGVANLLSGLSGGLVGFHALGLSSLCRAKLGSQSRWTGLIAASMMLVVLLFGAALVANVPRFIFGGLLLYLGLDFLWDWVWRSRQRLPLIDYGIILAILISMIGLGVLPAVGVGIAIAIATFLWNYSRTNIVRHHLSGQTLGSHVDREPNKQKTLRDLGQHIQILQLQGYLFFGSTQQLLEKVKSVIAPKPQVTDRQFIVMDFQQVSGLDSSVTYTFTKLKQLVPNHVQIVLAGLKPAYQRLLQRAGCIVDNDPVYSLAEDLDQSLEWCEEQLLEAIAWRRSRFMPLAMLLESLFEDAEQIPVFMGYLDRLELAIGQTLFEQQDVADRLYFLEFGQIATVPDKPQSEQRRVSYRDGTVIGAAAFYQRCSHRVTAIAQQPSSLYMLTRDRWQAMLHEQPKAAAVFQIFLLTQVTGQLERAHTDLNTLLF